MRVTLLGLGSMGRAIAVRLLGGGHHLTVWNRTSGRAGPLIAAGAREAADPVGAVADAEAVLTVIAGEAANRSLYDALARTPAPVIANLSTQSPAAMQALATRIGAERFVDSPVLGTVGPAEQGRLLTLAGGSPTAIAMVSPALASFSRRIVHVGAIGAASAMKITHNTILSLYWRSVAEAFAYGSANGLALADMVDIVGDSFAANGQWASKAKILTGEDAGVGFTLANLVQELALFERLFAEAGVHAPMIHLAHARAEAANAAGWGGSDVVNTAVFDLSERAMRPDQRHRQPLTVAGPAYRAGIG